VFQSRHGLMDLVMEDLQTDGSEPIYPPLHYASKTLEFCFTHSNTRYGETFYSFVNGQYTSRRRHALERVSRRLAQGGQRIRQRQIRRRRRARVHGRRGGHPVERPGVRVADQKQTGQHGNPHGLVNNVREELLHFFNRNKQTLPKNCIAKVEDTRQLRKELQEVKKLARERAKAITAHPAAEGLQKSFRQ
jgi:topoisomerase-4 subunit B